MCGVWLVAAAGEVAVRAPWLFRVTLGEVRWWVESVGYWFRPYDMLADARRWRWQARTPCQRGGIVTGVSDRPDLVRFLLSQGEKITTRERAVELGLAAAWDASRRPRGDAIRGRPSLALPSGEIVVSRERAIELGLRSEWDAEVRRIGGTW